MTDGAPTHALDAAHLDELAEALAALAGTDAGEQVLISGSGWRIDVASMDLGDGEQLAVYVEYGRGPALEQRGLELPPGSDIEADEGTAATVTFGPLSPPEAAVLLHAWTRQLGGDEPSEWTTTLEE